MENNDIRLLFDELNEKPIIYQRIYAKISGRAITGLILSQLVYWARTMKWEEFYKTDAELSEETGASIDEIRSARASLMKLSFFSAKRRGTPAKMWYKIDQDKLVSVITSYGKSPNKTSEIPEHTYTENNTENNTESSASTAPLIKEKNKKPQTARGWTNLRRIEAGKEPLRTPRSKKQIQTFDAIKWKDYFRDQGYTQHGMQFFLVDSAKREAAVSKLIISAYKVLGDDIKQLIDWWFNGAGEWAQYEPEQCFMGKTIERFKNQGKGVKKFAVRQWWE